MLLLLLTTWSLLAFRAKADVEGGGAHDGEVRAMVEAPRPVACLQERQDKVFVAVMSSLATKEGGFVGRAHHEAAESVPTEHDSSLPVSTYEPPRLQMES